MSQQDRENCERLKKEGSTPIGTSLGDKLKAAGVGPSLCPSCHAPNPVNEGASGFCRECGAAWCNYITFRFTIDKDGALADEAKSAT